MVLHAWVAQFNDSVIYVEIAAKIYRCLHDTLLRQTVHPIDMPLEGSRYLLYTSGHVLGTRCHPLSLKKPIMPSLNINPCPHT